MLVLGVFERGGFSGAHIGLIGVGWALAAAVCAACYFLMSPAVAATAGLIVGAAAVAALGLSGVMPPTFTTNDAVVAGLTTSWLVQPRFASSRPVRGDVRCASEASSYSSG
jgi:hypothetical protein